MATHSFTLILNSDVPFTDEVAESVFLKVGDDTLFGMCNAAPYIDFDREADSFAKAVLSAIEDVEGIGLRVEHVEPDDYVNAAEIARRLGRSRENVRQFICGDRGRGDFPPPVCSVAERSPRWRWADVAPWSVREGMLAAEESDRASFLALVNACLDWRRLGQATGADDVRCALLAASEKPLALPRMDFLREYKMMDAGQARCKTWQSVTGHATGTSDTSALIGVR